MMRREMLIGLGAVASAPSGNGGRESARVSVDLVENDALGLPHAIGITVESWGDADAVRVIQPSSVPVIQTIEPDDPALPLVLDNLDVTASVLAESVHGEWRTTIAEKWIAPGPSLADEPPELTENTTTANAEKRTEEQ